MPPHYDVPIASNVNQAVMALASRKFDIALLRTNIDLGAALYLAPEKTR